MLKNEELVGRKRIIDLFGSKWVITFRKQVYKENGNSTHDTEWVFGFSDSQKKTIDISLFLDDGKAISEEEIRITLLHELVHAIFATGQYNDSCNDEPLVEWTARCLNYLLKLKVLE